VDVAQLEEYPPFKRRARELLFLDSINRSLLPELSSAPAEKLLGLFAQ